MGVFGLNFVMELLLDEAAQTHNPYTILNPYPVWMLYGIYLFDSCIRLLVIFPNVRDIDPR